MITANGTAWFSNIEIEKGTQDVSSTWKFALFICENIDTQIEKDGIKQNVNISMSEDDVNVMVEDFSRFKNTIKTLSGNKMNTEIKIYDIKEPIKTLSYDDENGYFVAPKDVENLIDSKVYEEKFDHIFIAVRFGNMLKNTEIPVNDWIGLGYMDYYGIGFSNIRLPNSTNSYLYKYDSKVNIFPEEVFVHEFLHSLERELNERNYNIPELHSYKKYGYKNSSLEGLRDWYKDYMQKNIKSGSEYIGLYEDVYTIKPVKESCFEYATKLNLFDEPKTILGEIGKLLTTIF